MDEKQEFKLGVADNGADTRTIRSRVLDRRFDAELPMSPIDRLDPVRADDVGVRVPGIKVNAFTIR
jgi:hypothetical protein